MARWLVILTLLLAPLGQAQASRQSPALLPEPLHKVGQATLTWWLWEIYDSSLWTENGKFTGLPMSYPLALQITYRRDITRQQLIDATADQWQHLGMDPDSDACRRWLAKLNDLWPNIRQGDQLIYYVDDRQTGYFYSQNRLLGKVDDPAFSNAFLSIWLDPGTSQPELRRSLIGLD